MDLEFLCGTACQLSVSAGAGGDTDPSSEDGNIGFPHILIVHNVYNKIKTSTWCCVGRNKNKLFECT